MNNGYMWQLLVVQSDYSHIVFKPIIIVVRKK